MAKMKEYKYVLFDLDGTLTDPGEGITNSVEYALKKFGIDVKDKKEIFSFIGPPLIDSFMNYCGFSEEKAKLAVKYYREYYCEKGIFENFIISGIPELLSALQKNGKTIVMATSKPEVFAEKIAKKFGIAKYFKCIVGSNLDESRAKKSEVIAYALEKSGAVDKNKAVMIGDREYDIMGARENGIDSIGVLFGYGSEKELKTAGASYIAPLPSDILKIIIRQS